MEAAFLPNPAQIAWWGQAALQSPQRMHSGLLGVVDMSTPMAANVFANAAVGTFGFINAVAVERNPVEE